jgi:sigma-B regulation protein RsbU (phosphoserine phosphatase)
MAVQDIHTSQPLIEENVRLKRAVEELSILNDLARAIGASVNSQDIMHTIIHRSLRAINAEQGVITLVDPDANAPMKTLVRTMASSAQNPRYHFNQSLLGWMHLNKRPLALNDPANDSRFRGVQWDASIKSLLCVPMMIKSELKGVLTVYNKKDGKQFTDEDQRLLAIIAAQSAQVVENARLYESEQALLRMKEEVRLAARIQTDLLPSSAPVVEGYDIAGRSVPAQVVGGDYFDFIPTNDDRIAICLGDVSGKGLPASLLMANVQATLRGQTLLNVSPRVCIQRANKLLYLSTSPEKFVTLFYAILDPKRHQLSFSNAGHDNPFLLTADRGTQRLQTGGVVLSILEDFPYEEETVDIEPGGMLVIYSDGITEAVNPAEEQFGEGRLAKVIQDNAQGSATGLVERIISDVNTFAGGRAQADDMTLVVVKRNSSAASGT